MDMDNLYPWIENVYTLPAGEPAVGDEMRVFGVPLPKEGSERKEPERGAEFGTRTLISGSPSHPEDRSHALAH
jgi:hypothetical protein